MTDNREAFAASRLAIAWKYLAKYKRRMIEAYRPEIEAAALRDMGAIEFKDFKVENLQKLAELKSILARISDLSWNVSHDNRCRRGDNALCRRGLEELREEIERALSLLPG